MAVHPPGAPAAYRWVVRTMRPLMMALTRREWSGQEHLPRTGGFIAVSNHLSFADPIVFGHYLNDNGVMPHYLGKVEVFQVPVLGAIVRGAEQIPVHRESDQAGDAFRAAVEAVNEGKCVVLYPEGTITRDPDLWPMRGKTGAARIALATGCPVIPIAQWGSHTILAPYAKVPKLMSRHTVRVVAGPPVNLDDLRDQPVSAEVTRTATDRIMADLTGLLEGIRGERAPATRYDPAAEHISVIGRPRPVPVTDPEEHSP